MKNQTTFKVTRINNNTAETKYEERKRRSFGAESVTV